MTDYYSNQPPSNPYPSSGPHPSSNNPYQQSNPYPGNNPYQPNPPSNPFPASSYPQSPPTGVPAQPQNFPATGSFSSYYTSSQPALSPQEPQRPKSTAKVVLIVAALLAFVAAGVFTSLYLTAKSDHDKAVSVLEDKKAELSDVRKAITSAEEEKSNAEKTNSDLESQNNTLQPCVDATMYFLWEAPEAELDAAVQKMRDVCK